MDSTIIKYNIGSFSIEEYAELNSTNSVAASLPFDERSDGKVILTWRQTAGKGQGSNRWESEPEKNISLSVILCPKDLNATNQFDVSMCIAMGCIDLLALYAVDALVKWPNDIYIGDSKIGGILIEHVVMGAFVDSSICGIGLNINQEQFLSDAPNPISLKQATKNTYNLHDVLRNLLDAIDKRYKQMNESPDILRVEYLSKLYRREGIYEWKDSRGIFKASFAGIDEFGRLRLLDEKNALRVYGFKEIIFV